MVVYDIRGAALHAWCKIKFYLCCLRFITVVSNFSLRYTFTEMIVLFRHLQLKLTANLGKSFNCFRLALTFAPTICGSTLYWLMQGGRSKFGYRKKEVLVFIDRKLKIWSRICILHVYRLTPSPWQWLNGQDKPCNGKMGYLCLWDYYLFVEKEKQQEKWRWTKRIHSPIFPKLLPTNAIGPMAWTPGRSWLEVSPQGQRMFAHLPRGKPPSDSLALCCHLAGANLRRGMMAEMERWG